ncbi:MAG: hypothetical protein KDC76_09685 [Bacteroidetes bacterium]|nr:hypothetical protein [Bacteroidota bacterium]
MNRVLVISILIVWLAPGILLQLGQEVGRLHFRSAFEQTVHHLKGNDLTILEFNGLDEVNWVKDQKELELDGVRYDVVRISHLSDRVVIHCFEDWGETRLIKQIIQRKQAQSNAKKKRVRTMVYLPASGRHSIEPCSHQILRMERDYSCPTAETEIPHPPPKSIRSSRGF